jgi:D-alanyl-D-alanine carboxypeptidase
MRCLFLATGLALSVGIAQPVAAAEAELDAQVHNLLVLFKESYGFPGATAAYVLADGTSGGAAVGLADVEAGIPMTRDSRMLAASIGKSIVGALVLSLESEGVLTRSDLVYDHLGNELWFSDVPNSNEMTVGHLLTHSSGLPDHVHMDGVAHDSIQASRKGMVRPEDAISHVQGHTPLFEAGSAWTYSDTGYLLLGLVIEAAAGKVFFDLAQEHFLTPLDLAQTSPSNNPKLDGLAVGYTAESTPFGLPTRTMDDAGVLLWNPAIEWTGGGFVSTSQNLARWGHALFSGEAMEGPYLNRLLDGAPIHPDAPGVLYGQGVVIYSETEFGPVYGHGGWIPGYVSSLRHYAEHRVTIAFQINSDVGIVDDSTDLVPSLETALVDLFVDAIWKAPVAK